MNSERRWRTSIRGIRRRCALFLLLLLLSSLNCKEGAEGEIKRVNNKNFMGHITIHPFLEFTGFGECFGLGGAYF